MVRYSNILELREALVDAKDPIVEAVSLPGSSSGSCKVETCVSWRGPSSSKVKTRYVNFHVVQKSPSKVKELSQQSHVCQMSWLCNVGTEFLSLDGDGMA